MLCSKSLRHFNLPHLLDLETLGALSSTLVALSSILVILEKLMPRAFRSLLSIDPPSVVFKVPSENNHECSNASRGLTSHILTVKFIIIKNSREVNDPHVELNS